MFLQQRSHVRIFLDFNSLTLRTFGASWKRLFGGRNAEGARQTVDRPSSRRVQLKPATISSEAASTQSKGLEQAANHAVAQG
jgi:hypothetical protein